MKVKEGKKSLPGGGDGGGRLDVRRRPRRRDETRELCFCCLVFLL